MKNGICPKCSSEEIYIDSNNRHGIGKPIQEFSAQTHYYCCTDCGYIEIYAQTGYDLSKAKEKFIKVKK